METNTTHQTECAHDRQMLLEHHAISSFSCKLLADTITGNICMVRKRYLHGRNAFSCTGCIIETSPTHTHATAQT